MAQVILIEDNKTVNELLTVNMASFLGVDIIDRKNAQEALTLLSILPNIDLIITTYKVNEEETAKTLIEFIKKNKLEISVIVLGGPEINVDDFDFCLQVDNPKDWEKVIQLASQSLGINEDAILKRNTPDYIPVPVKYFLNLDQVNCDVFIRIKKSATDYQYIKRIHNGDTFSRDAIKRYQSQGLENFFIAKENAKNFAIFLSNRLVEKLDNPDLPEDTKIQIMGESYEIAIKEISKLGFTTESIQLTETIVQNMVKTFEKSPEMSSLLHRIINSKTGQLYQRCHMTSIVASEVLKNLKISNQLSYEKIAYASFFHDIMLVEKEELSKINSFEELERAELNEEDWDLVFNHAFEASVLIRKHPEAPTGVDEIIKNHHGTTNGKGFSLNVDKLSDLSKVFIIAHNFVLELLMFKERGGEAKPITEDLLKKYNSPDMVLIIKALEKTLKKKKA